MKLTDLLTPPENFHDFFRYLLYCKLRCIYPISGRHPGIGWHILVPVAVPPFLKKGKRDEIHISESPFQHIGGSLHN